MSLGIYGTIEGVGPLAKHLQTKTRKLHSGRVVVGYETPYAIYVHEDPDAHHGADYNLANAADISKGLTHRRRAQERYKFLEEPAVFFRREIRDYIKRKLREGKTLRQALKGAGQILLKESKKLVPIDTGALSKSGFVTFEET